jgi:glucokinase
MSQPIYVGVDLGGTAIKVGICDEQGRLMKTFEGPTEAEGGPETVLNNIEKYVRQLVSDSSYSWEQVQGIGAGIPGFLDIANGIVVSSGNLKWYDVPVKAILEQKLGKSVHINNDANVAALGEVWSGAGAGYDYVVCLTLGTGVGGGIIINGKIYEGYIGMAGELGHIQVVPDLEGIQCGCGQMGCLETVSSATGIIRMAADAVERGERTTLSAVQGQLTAKDVFDAAKIGDDVALRIIRRAAHYLGKAMGTMAVVLNPQRFIIGGGVSRAGDLLFDGIRESFAKYTPEASRRGVDIVPAVLGNDAGVVGAAGLSLKQIR